MLKKYYVIYFVLFLFQKQEKNASYHGESLSDINAAQQKRYITRSTAKKVSKSMSDLNEM